MKAMVLSGFGRAPELSELEIPRPGPGELRVRVRAASVNGFDLSVANGRLRGVMRDGRIEIEAAPLPVKSEHRSRWTVAVPDRSDVPPMGESLVEETRRGVQRERG